MSSQILQPAASTNWLERALEHGMSASSDFPVQITDIKNHESCPEDFLPYLAWEQSISDEEGWSFAESVEGRRNLIKCSAEIHKKKGTVWAIREVFRMLDLGEVEIVENIGRLRHDGQFKRNGEMLHGGDPEVVWATYIVRLFTPITLDQAEIIRRILNGVAPARSELVKLDYTQAYLRHDGRHLHNGQYTRGTV